jgi:hypothetical protein
MSNANRRAMSSAARVTSSRRPTGSSSRSSIGTVMTLSQLMTQRSGSPCSGPTSTSVRIPRIVRVIGAHVTELNTAMAASRVRMQTGRRPAGGPRSAQMCGPRRETARRLNECRVGRLTLVPGDELSVGRCELLGGNHCGGAPAEQLGPVRSEPSRELVEPFDQVVVELDKNFSSGHDHMLSPMVRTAGHRVLKRPGHARKRIRARCR